MDHFHRAMKRYYQREHERSERCLGDIIEILDGDGMSAEQKQQSILARLVEHYRRDDERLLNGVQQSPPK